MAQVQNLAFGIELELLIMPKHSAEAQLKAQGWDSEMFIRKWKEWDPLNREMGALRMDEARNRKKIRNLQPRLLTASVQPDRARKMLYAYLAWLLSQKGIPTTLRLDYSKWSLKDEVSLDEAPGYWRIEIISRVFQTDQPWQDEIYALFKILSDSFHIHLTPSCSLHVHVSPGLGNSRYTVDELKRMLKAIARFDQAITKIMPPDHKDNGWAEGNPQAPGVHDGLKKLYEAVPSKGWAPLFQEYDRLNDPRLVHNVIHNKNRNLSWNFQNVTNRCGTIEFRRPPGVGSAAQAIHWAGFALCFVAEAINNPWNHPSYIQSKTHGNVEELRAFLRKGESILLPCSRSAYVPGWIVEDKRPATTVNSRKSARMKVKKLLKNAEESPFAEKINSPSNSPATSRSSSTDSWETISSNSSSSRSKMWGR